MQNELKASSSGTVGKVSVTEGATVEVGSPLITIMAPAAS
jgi:biotin carboxyl carrier protein